MDSLIHNRAARGRAIKPIHLFGAVALIAILFLAFTPTPNAINQAISQQVSNTASVNTNLNLCSVTKPLSLTAYNGLAGTALNAPTIAIFTGSSPYTQQSSAAASSAGVLTTGASYTTGTTLKIRTIDASLARNQIDFTVPPMTCGDNATNNVVAIYGIVLGAWTTTMTGTGGTTLSTGKQYLITAFTGNTVDITFTLSETTANAGYKSSFDYVNGVWNYFVFEMSTAGTALGLDGFLKTALKGSTSYYFAICGDGISGQGYGSSGGTGAYTAQSGTGQSKGVTSNCVGSLSSQTIGTSVYGGTAAIKFTVKQGSQAKGDAAQTLTFKYWSYADVDNYINKNTYGPDVTQVGSSITLSFVS